MATKVDIISNAFVELGEEPVNDLSVPSDNPLINAANNLYEVFIEWVFSSHDWKFATFLDALPLSGTPSPLPDTFRFAYELFPDIMRITTPVPITLDVERIGNLYLANIEDLELLHVKRVEEILFPSYFTSMAQAGMAAKLARVVTQNETIAESLKGEFGEQLIQAQSRDSMQVPNQPLISDPLFSAHQNLGTV